MRCSAAVQPADVRKASYLNDVPTADSRERRCRLVPARKLGYL